MIPERIHWLEKVQVQVAVVATAGAVFLYFWRCAQAADPVGPATFLATGSTAGLIGTAVMFLVLAVVCGMLTVTSRPEGALAAALLGLGGISLRSASLEVLLQQSEGSFRSIYTKMSIELLLFAALVLVGLVLLGLARGLVAAVRPGWLWRDLRENVDEEDVKRHVEESRRMDSLEKRRMARKGIFGNISIFSLGNPAVATFWKKGNRRETLLRCLGCLGLAAAISGMLVFVLMQSALRGQIVFALFGSFVLGVAIAHQLFPAPCGMAAWLLPVVVGILYYVLGIVWVGQGGWMEMRPQAQGLPIDWIAAGGGGAMLGYWISARIHEARYLEQEEEAEGA
jgi:hypothetical protein